MCLVSSGIQRRVHPPEDSREEKPQEPPIQERNHRGFDETSESDSTPSTSRGAADDG